MTMFQSSRTTAQRLGHLIHSSQFALTPGQAALMRGQVAQIGARAGFCSDDGASLMTGAGCEFEVVLGQLRCHIS